MAAITHVYTIDRAAKMLGVSVDLLHELSITMEPEDGVLWVLDNTEEGCCAFTDFGIENAAEQLSDPSIVAHLQQLIQQQ
ncbi:MAG: hypothetical protein ACLPPF_24115 [Rhodomicrobium sp.]